VRQTCHNAVGGFPDTVREDTDYVKLLAENGAQAYFLGEVRVTNSSRRAKKDGMVSLLLDFLPQGTRGTRFIYRLFGKTPRKYGHYEKPGDMPGPRC